MIEVALRFDDVIEEYNEFSDAKRAEVYFNRLARTRSRQSSVAIATVDGDVRMLYHTADVYGGNRWEVSTDLISGLPVKRRYIPSMDELTGRKSKIRGIMLPPLIVPLELRAQLQEKAARMGKSLNDLRKEAYLRLLDEEDTILSQVVS